MFLLTKKKILTFQVILVVWSSNIRSRSYTDTKKEMFIILTPCLRVYALVSEIALPTGRLKVLNSMSNSNENT